MAGNGPLPERERKRRNAPTIPTTNLPAGGRTGPTPVPPLSPVLGVAGLAWWAWAWSTPQACGWGTGVGQEVAVARRASLEDDMAALAAVESLDLLDVLEAKAPEVRAVVRHLAGLAGGKLGVCREMRELDDRLGLTPKAMAQLRWLVVADAVDEDVVVGDEVKAKREGRRARLTG